MAPKRTNLSFTGISAVDQELQRLANQIDSLIDWSSKVDANVQPLSNKDYDLGEFNNRFRNIFAEAVFVHRPVFEGPTLNLQVFVDDSAGTITLKGADERDLSPENPGYVRIKTNVYAFTSNIVLDESDLAGNLAGTAAGVAYASNRPHWIYFGENDAQDTCKPFLCAIPHIRTAPAAADIGAPDDAVADEQYSLFCWENIDETLYDDNSCVPAGSIRMTKNSSDEWAFTAMDDEDGIGEFNDKRWFTHVAGHNGADSGEFLASAGTLPSFTDQVVEYKWQQNGDYEYSYLADGDGGTDGSGSNTVFLHLPYDHGKNLGVPDFLYVGKATTQFGGKEPPLHAFLDGDSSTTRKRIAFSAQSDSSGSLKDDTGNLVCSDFVNGSRWLTFQGLIYAYRG